MSINLGENKLSDVIKMDTGTGGSNDYNDLNNKPQINGITLQGNKTSAELGIITGPTDVYTKQETDNLIDAKITEAGATKADISYVNEQLNLKASKSDVNLALASKADVNSVYTKEETTSAINSAITGKADTSYVNEQLNLKADKSNTYTKSEVDTEINDLESTINVKLNNKADKSSTYTKEETNQTIADNITEKADTSYVNEQLALKADKSDTYSKEEIDEKLDNPTITGDTLPVGSVVEWTGTQTPQNWLLCDGREVSRTTYSELFAAIGTVWGAGDGSTSFNIPDYRDKFVLGAGGDVDLAETGGEKEVTLTVEQIPPHRHQAMVSSLEGSDETITRGTTKGVWRSLISSTGGGQAHNNMPPYVGTYYIIKAKQSAGVVATVVDNLSSTSPTDALSANQGKILNDKINLLSSMCQLMHKNSITINGSAWNKVLFKSYTEKVEIGTGLKGDITKGTITIGKNIKTVLIGGSAVINSDQPAERYKVSIYCNDKEITHSSYTKPSTNMDFAFAMTPYLLSVKENDVITLQITTTSNGQKYFSDIYLNVMTLN